MRLFKMITKIYVQNDRILIYAYTLYFMHVNYACFYNAQRLNFVSKVYIEKIKRKYNKAIKKFSLNLMFAFLD